MRGTPLPEEIRAFLVANGPATSPEIALAVRARRTDVDRALAEGPFTRAGRPDGTSGRGKYWNASQLVRVPRGGKSREALMLDVLRDGRWHSRRDLWDAAGKFFLTNNAAAELRRKGHNVVYDRGRDAYRLAPAAAMRAPRSVSVSGDAPPLKVAAA
jgi:hypothetical protein